MKRATRETHPLIYYNGVDCIATALLAERLGEKLEHLYRHIYEFERSLLPLCLKMQTTGIRVDTAAWAELKAEVRRKAEAAIARAQRLGVENPRSPVQIQQAFARLGVSLKKADRSTIEKLVERNPEGSPVRLLAEALVDVSEYAKLKSILDFDISPDGYFHASFSPLGTSTGRWNSSTHPRGYGTNMQNLPESIRHIFVARPGYVLAYIDKEQAESRATAYISGDEAYINACESGDLHTMVCKMVWRDLPWTGDPVKDKKEVAGQLFYREKSYRDIAKILGHGSNYGGTPKALSMFSHVPQKLIEDFQRAYFRAFPKIREWHRMTSMALMATATVVTPFGRARHFWDRPRSHDTWKKAVAFQPQSLVADELSLRLLEVYRTFDWDEVRILAQVHDAGLFEIREDANVLEDLVEILQRPLWVYGRQMVIPVEPKVGLNWGKASEDNPDGQRVVTVQQPHGVPAKPQALS